MNTLSIGLEVNVQKWTGDIFDNDFTGHIKLIREARGDDPLLVCVEDMEGNCFDVELGQLLHKD